jgi:hypothetical protein
MGRTRKKKSSVSVQISRPDSAIVASQAQIVRTLSVARQANGRLSTTSGFVTRKSLPTPTYTLSQEKPTAPQVSREPFEAYVESGDTGMGDYDSTDGKQGEPADPKVCSVTLITITLAWLTTFSVDRSMIGFHTGKHILMN